MVIIYLFILQMMFEKNPDSYSVKDRLLHNLTSIHLCAKYNAPALSVIFRLLDDHSVWRKFPDKVKEVLKDQGNSLKMSPLHLAVENPDQLATRYKRN